MSTITTDEITTLADTKADTNESVEIEGAKAQRMTNPMKVVIFSSFVLRFAGAMTTIFLSSLLKQELNAGTGLIGTLYALFYLTELTMSPVFGAISDLRGRRMILILGPLVGAAAVLIYPLSAVAGVSLLGIAILGLARLAEGISTAAKVPSALGYLADATSGAGKVRAALRGRVMGLYEVTFLVGLVFGQVLGGRLWESVHVWGFFLVSLVYLVAVALLYFFVPETLPAEARAHNMEGQIAAGEKDHPIRALLSSRLRAYAQLLREPTLRSFVPAWLAINAVVGLFGNLAQPILIKSKDGVDNFPNQMLDGKFTTSDAGMMFGLFGIVFMVGIFVWSMLYARVRKSTVMLIGSIGLFLTCLALYAINDQLLPAAVPWLWIPSLVLGLFMVSGFTPVALAYLAEISGARVEHRGAVMGLYSVFLGLGQLLGSGGGGIFVEGLPQGFNGLILAVLLLG
ncbi:MAG: MFS transporter, partial [Chloroflexia bacterium]